MEQNAGNFSEMMKILSKDPEKNELPHETILEMPQ